MKKLMIKIAILCTMTLFVMTSLTAFASDKLITKLTRKEKKQAKIEIKNAVKAMEKYWNNRNVEKFMRSFVEDARFVTHGGQTYIMPYSDAMRRSIISRMANQGERKYTNTRVIIKEKEKAVVHTKLKFEKSRWGALPILYKMIKQDGEWLVIARTPRKRK